MEKYALLNRLRENINSIKTISEVANEQANELNYYRFFNQEEKEIIKKNLEEFIRKSAECSNSLSILLQHVFEGEEDAVF